MRSRSLARARCARADPDIEDVAAFGERLHMRLRAGAATSGPESVLERLTTALMAAGVQIDELRAIPPSLEDVFIALQEGIALTRAPGQNGNANRDEAAHA